jgi:A/G-specific adenine glycosylase
MLGEVGQFRNDLLFWYRRNARDLPWRRTRDPYAVWVSEIMLQQTRVAAVIEYFNRFLEHFPTIEALAAAHEDAVLALWSGLGYYRRARMMHKTAQILSAEHGGRMPSTAAELRKLPGIGEYTSAAIASISFGERVPVIDGNVERVLLRLNGKPADGADAPAQAVLRSDAEELLDPANPGDFNQAMMELGATVCLPRGPLCVECPVLSHCRTRGEHVTAPAKRMRSQQVAYALITRESHGQTEILMTQRGPGASLMPGMWELPAVAPGRLAPESIVLTVRHAITNTNYYVAVHSAGPEHRKTLSTPKAELHWVGARELRSLPLTGLARKTLKRLRILPAYAMAAQPS